MFIQNVVRQTFIKLSVRFEYFLLEFTHGCNLLLGHAMLSVFGSFLIPLCLKYCFRNTVIICHYFSSVLISGFRSNQNEGLWISGDAALPKIIKEHKKSPSRFYSETEIKKGVQHRLKAFVILLANQ